MNNSETILELTSRIAALRQQLAEAQALAFARAVQVYEDGSGPGGLWDYFSDAAEAILALSPLTEAETLKLACRIVAGSEKVREVIAMHKDPNNYRLCGPEFAARLQDAIREAGE